MTFTSSLALIGVKKVVVSTSPEETVEEEEEVTVLIHHLQKGREDKSLIFLAPQMKQTD